MDEIIAWLTTLLDFDTTARGPDAGACVDFIGRVLSMNGVKIRVFETCGGHRQAHHLLAEVSGERPEAVLLHAHLDTADFGDPTEWIFPAQRASRRRGCVCGRGALDCKGPLAVWMKLLSDAAGKTHHSHTLKLLVSDLEEDGGEFGLKLLLRQHPGILTDVKLVIGEGGGFPFPFRDTLYYTFQTGAREDDPEENAEDLTSEEIASILSIGIGKGYYSRDVLSYAACAGSLSRRRLDIRPLYAGMEAFFREAADSDVYRRYGQFFTDSLRKEISNACLMPCITPGYSDNRWFRKASIPVIGFFPLDKKNSLGGIHGSNEYISEASLALAYRVMSDILAGLQLT